MWGLHMKRCLRDRRVVVDITSKFHIKYQPNSEYNIQTNDGQVRR